MARAYSKFCAATVRTYESAYIIHPLELFVILIVLSHAILVELRRSFTPKRSSCVPDPIKERERKSSPANDKSIVQRVFRPMHTSCDTEMSSLASPSAIRIPLNSSKPQPDNFMQFFVYTARSHMFAFVYASASRMLCCESCAVRIFIRRQEKFSSQSSRALI